MAVNQRAVMQLPALKLNPKAQINATSSSDMLNTDWTVPALMALQIMMKQDKAFDQAPMAKMRPPQLMPKP
jgi:hypothetical protein